MTKRKMLEIFNNYLNSCNTSLYDVYDTPSCNKLTTYSECMVIFEKMRGIQPRIVSANTHHFTFGFTTQFLNMPHFIWVTKNWIWLYNLKNDTIKRITRGVWG